MECPYPHKSLSCPTQVLQDLTYLEFFAGEGEVFRCIRGDHHPSCAVDLEYMEGRGHAMDVNSPSGLAFLPLHKYEQGLIGWPSNQRHRFLGGYVCIGNKCKWV